MDSIDDNVMVIICVVVGILIIGCALVPIVENASIVETETHTYEETSGYNTPLNGPQDWYGGVTELLVVADGTTTTVNGTVYEGAFSINLRPYVTESGYAYVNTAHKIGVTTALSGGSNLILLNEGTITYNDGVLTVTGTNSGGTQTFTKNTNVLYISDATALSSADETEFYGLVSSPFVIGEGQQCMSQNGQTVITPESEAPAGLRIVRNDDGTATVTIESGSWYGPYKWTGTITHTETTTADSEYKDLYNIIPVLCILGMAYVLIRRFY